MIHIVNADDAGRKALDAGLRQEGFLTASSRDLASFLSALGGTWPDAAIASIPDRRDDALSALRRIRSLRHAMTVFVIAERPDVDLAVIAMKAGAADVFTTPLDVGRIVRSVRESLRHVPQLALAVGAPELSRFAHLSSREREVLQLIADGRSNKQVGRELGISPRTVEGHRARVMEKLGARNTADLMRIVLAG